MTIDREDVVRSRRSVDESQDMFLALREGGVEVSPSAGQRVVAHPIDNKTVCVGEPTCFLNVEANESRVMHVVLNQNRTKVDIPIAAGGAMDD